MGKILLGMIGIFVSCQSESLQLFFILVGSKSNISLTIYLVYSPSLLPNSNYSIDTSVKRATPLPPTNTFNAPNVVGTVLYVLGEDVFTITILAKVNKTPNLLLS